MGIFDFFKRVLETTDRDSEQTTQNVEIKVGSAATINGKTSTLEMHDAENDELFPTDFEHLTKDGELPFGWEYRNRGFTDKIRSEYSYFLDMWINNRKGTLKDQYQALKSFVVYLEDLERLCKSKGECFEFWFYEILASRDYIEKRKKELVALTAKIKAQP